MDTSRPRTATQATAQPVGMGARLRALNVGVVLSSLAVALVVTAIVSVLAGLAFAAMDSGSIADDLPSIVQVFGCFFGFLAGGVFAASRAHEDRMLHAVALAVAGFAVAALLTILDLAMGMSVASVMPGRYGTDEASVHLGFWVVNWVVVPTAAMLGASIVPRGPEGWGTTYSEHEDTQL
ncbi:MAG: hypothetical protein JWM98_2730 [Thermoleophilia bacterium]|nr:hypothetical protein [Thermoleophilia bacterium]